jgi:hypothetical protein
MWGGREVEMERRIKGRGEFFPLRRHTGVRLTRLCQTALGHLKKLWQEIISARPGF